MESQDRSNYPRSRGRAPTELEGACLRRAQGNQFHDEVRRGFGQLGDSSWLCRSETVVGKRVLVIIRVVIAVAIIGGLVTWGIVSHVRSRQKETQKEREEQQQTEAREKEIEQSIFRILQRHNAVTNWSKRFRGNRTMERIYSAELSSALIRPDGRPVLFYGSLQDVTSEGDRYTVRLLVSVNVTTEMRLVLDCDPDLVGRALKQPREPDDQWAVVAQVSSVRTWEHKPAENTEAGSETELGSVGYGKCIDLICLGPYLADTEDMLRDAPD